MHNRTILEWALRTLLIVIYLISSHPVKCLFTFSFPKAIWFTMGALLCSSAIRMTRRVAQFGIVDLIREFDTVLEKQQKT